MRRLIKNGICLILMLCMTVGAFAACKEPSDESIPPITVEKTDAYIFEKGASDYKVVIPANPTTYELFAAQEFVELMNEALDYTFEIIDDEGLRYHSDGEYFSIGATALEKSGGILVDEGAMGRYGYRLSTKGKTIFVSGCNTDYGVLFGTYKLLYHLVGFESYYYNVYDIRRADSLPFHRINGIEKPANGLIDLRIQNTDATSALRMFSSSNGDNNKRADGGLNIGHNLPALIDPGKYEKEHPDWFVPPGLTYERQLCLSAEDMMEELSRVVFVELIKPQNADVNYFLFGPADGGGVCNCDRCKLLLDRYEQKNSALAVRLVNRVGANVDRMLSEYGDKRKMTWSFLLYNEYTEPPVKATADGYAPYDDSVVPAKNTAVQFTPINVDFSRKLDDSESNLNKVVFEQLKGWQSVTDSLEYYGYSASFQDFFFGYNDWGSTQNLMQHLAASGTVYNTWNDVMNQSNPVFQELRAYLWTKLSFDPYLGYDELVKKFCNFYYQDAAKYVLSYYDELRAHYAFIQNEKGVPGTIYYTHESKNWPYSVLQRFEHILDMAVQSVEKYQQTNPQLYKTLCERINKETLLYRYATLQWYYGYYTKEQQMEMVDALAADCAAYGVREYREGASVEIRFNEFRSRI